MTIWKLLMLIGLAWLTYPLAGCAIVSADVAEGKRPKGAGFSFLPELIVFPAAFVGIAALIDVFMDPWGKWVIGAICVLMLVAHVYLFVRALLRIRSVSKSAD